MTSASEEAATVWLPGPNNSPIHVVSSGHPKTQTASDDNKQDMHQVLWKVGLHRLSIRGMMLQS
jgi:hypothetical protein